MADEKPIYVGKGKESLYGIKFSLNLSDMPKEHIYEYNGKQYINLEIKKMTNPDQYGKTHTITVNLWKPDGKKQDNNARPEELPTGDSDKCMNGKTDDSLPF